MPAEISPCCYQDGIGGAYAFLQENPIPEEWTEYRDTTSRIRLYSSFVFRNAFNLVGIL
jgi:hypothetical protein